MNIRGSVHKAHEAHEAHKAHDVYVVLAVLAAVLSGNNRFVLHNYLTDTGMLSGSHSFNSLQYITVID